MKGIGGFKGDGARERYLATYDEAMRLCPEPEAEFDVETTYGVTRVYRFGTAEGPPLVLLTGLGATSAALTPVIPGLALRHPVYTLDTIGEPGRSVQTAPLTGSTDRARWLDELLARLDLTGVHLVGFSSGGNYAINQAIHAPGALASVSLVEPTTVTAPLSAGAVLRALGAMLVNRDWAWRRTLRWFLGADLADRPDVRLVLAGIREYRVRLPPQRRPREDELRAVRLPVLALFAARSAVQNAPAAAERMRRLVPHAEVELWPDAQHHVPLDGPGRDRITERILDFVAGVVSV